MQKFRYEDLKREIEIYRQLTRRRMKLQALVFLPDFSEFHLIKEDKNHGHN